MTAEAQARTMLAFLTPRFSYIDGAANGKQIAAIDRIVLAPACADAVYFLYTSLRNINMARKTNRYPVPKRTPQTTIGTAG
jgi:hypothetical protein